MPVEPGQTLSHYRLIERIGQGGMGLVFLAQDTSLRRKVALKFLAEEIEQGVAARKRLLREAEAAAALDHPFICKIYETGDFEGQSFIVMEYVEGKTLHEKLKAVPLPLKETLHIAGEVAEALEGAHSHGIVHRDLKPSNIMQTPAGHVKVMDFGLAKRLAPAGEVVDQDQTLTATLTQKGATVGTLAYMSPEQLRGQPVDTRSDIFSFGVVLYEMLAGVHPFQKASPMDTADAILHENASPPTRYVNDVPELLQHTLRKMLAKEPDERYQSVHEVRTNLTRLLTDLDVTVRERSSAKAKAKAKAKAPWWVWPTLAVVALLAAVGVPWSLGVFQRTPEQPATVAAPQEQLPRLAVLAFDSLSGKPEDQAFSDGLTESLISGLAKLSGLQVISATSVKYLKDKQLPLPKIASLLNVDYIVEGSLLKSGDQCLVTAQLIRVSDDIHLWAEDFQLPWSDVFTILNEVSRHVVREVDLVLRPDEERLLGEAGTDNIEAYDALVKGKYARDQYLTEGTPEYFEVAEQYLKEALRLDPAFVEAMTRLGRLHMGRARFEGSTEGWNLAEELFEQALERNHRDPGAIAGLAKVARHRGDSERFFQLARRAVEYGPNVPETHDALGIFYYDHGFFEAAYSEFEKEERIKPFPPVHHTAISLWALGQFGEALERIRQDRKMASRAWRVDIVIAGWLVRLGDLDEAEKTAQEILEDPRIPQRERIGEVLLGQVNALRGDRKAARHVIEKYWGSIPKLQSWNLVLLCVWAGENGLAMELLEGGRHQGYRSLIGPGLRDLRDEPRFQALLRDANAQWESDLARYGPRLPVQPPRLPTPDEYLSQAD